MTRRLILLLTFGLASGCASASPAFNDRGSDGLVEVLVRNQSNSAVTVFAWWENAGRVTLGEVGLFQERTFTARYRAPGLMLTVDVLSGTRVGPGATPPTTFAPVRLGDRFEWTIGAFTQFDLSYVRLRPRRDVLAGGDMIPPRGGIPAAAPGSLPVAEDLLRVECFSPQDQKGRTAEGFFEGAGGGELRLSVGSQRQRVAVPVVNVTRVEVRRRRSRSGEGALIGALLGAASGAVIGDSKYDRESAFHVRQEIYGVAGGVAGALVGLAVGAGIGSAIKTDLWREVPQNWVVRYSASSSTTPEDSARTMGC